MSAGEARVPEAGEAESLVAWAGRALALRCLGAEPVPAGIGRRRFYRLRFAGTPASAIARVDAPEDPAGRPAGVPPEPPLEPVRALLERSGLPVPRRYAADAARGVELLEDFGDESLCDAFEAAPGAEAERLLAAAADLVPRLQRVRDDGSGVAAFGRRLDAALFRYKAELFARASLPLALGRAPRPAEARAVLDAFDWIAAHCARAPARFAHRDFQSQNLIVRRDPAARLGLIDRPELGLIDRPGLGLIDLQGAFLAPPEYDLVCLLCDSYLALPEALALRERERIRPALPDAPAADEFALRFELLTLTRKGKDHARFAEAVARGDARYRRFLAPTAVLLKRAAERTRGVAPSLDALGELVARLPEEPPCAR